MLAPEGEPPEEGATALTCPPPTPAVPLPPWPRGLPLRESLSVITRPCFLSLCRSELGTSWIITSPSHTCRFKGHLCCEGADASVCSSEHWDTCWVLVSGGSIACCC